MPDEKYEWMRNITDKGIRCIKLEVIVGVY